MTAVVIPAPEAEASDRARGSGAAYPDDWKVEALGEYVDIVSGESPSQFTFAASGTPYFKVEQLNNSNKHLGSRQTPYFTVDSRAVPAGSVIFPKRGASIMLNKVRLFAEAGYMDTNLMAITPRAGLISEYLYYLITYVKLWTFADTTSIPQINNKHIKPLMIPLPDVGVQRAIARALADLDESIDAAEALIAKRSAMRTGVMLALLTGSKRLPEFTGDWNRVRLGDVLSFLPTASNPRADLDMESETAYVHYGDVHGHGSPILDCSATRLPRIESGKLTVRSPLVEGDLVLVDASEDLEGLGTSVEVTHLGNLQAVAGLHTILCRGDERHWAPGFKAYLQFIPAFRESLRRVATGTSVYGITKRQVVEIEVQLPPVPEQAAISSVLADIESEREALVRRRLKLLSIKQGMLFELMSGRTRLRPVVSP
jgi:type I restriction enzyme S subunit